MSSMEGSLFERMSALTELTAADHSLANYFSKSFPNLAFQNLEAIGKGAGVSVASVTRFVRKLGYSDFKDFSAQLKAEVSANFDRPLTRPTSREKAIDADELAQHFSQVALELERSLPKLSSTEFRQIADLLADESRPLYLTAVASTRGLMEYFYMLLKYHRPQVFLLPHVEAHPHVLADIDSSGVLFTANFDRHPRPVEIALQYARSQSATTILLSNRTVTPLQTYADHVLVLDSNPNPRFKSRVGMLTVLEALLAAIQHRRPERVEERIKTIEKLIDEEGNFITPRISSSVE